MPLPPTLYCGPAGWMYQHWSGIVYPKTRPRGIHALELVSKYFDVVEINTSFYQPIRPEIARLWISKVAGNPRFQFTAKLHRRFTHERTLEPGEVAHYKEGLWPLLRARKLGCLLMQFPWTFRYTEENRNYLIELRRTFHEFPLVAEMRHSSWTNSEALGTLIDYRVGFCNIDQAAYTKATPPTAHLTSDIGYVRLHGRNPQDWTPESTHPIARHDYLYSLPELVEWQDRVQQIRQFAARTFVIANNDVAGKSVVNALQFAALCGDDRRMAPVELLHRYPVELAAYRSTQPLQTALFERAVA
jgi:uncharacterized protein YecE (DUF72 family)